MFFFNKNAIRNKFQHYVTKGHDLWLRLKMDKEDVATQNKKADIASAQSFPASDPPGHFSVSEPDKELHH
jgi:hypothetical protein